MERRNHYLNLTGIENYSSKFDNAGIGSDVDVKVSVHYWRVEPRKEFSLPLFSRNSGAQRGRAMRSRAPPCGHQGEKEKPNKAL